MTLPLFIGTIPDGSALQVLDWINNSFSALYSKSLSPTAPEDPIAGMEWINSGTGIYYIRDPQGVAWVPIGKFDAQSWIPFVSNSTGGGGGGDDDGDSTLLGPYASLAAGEGFATGSNGTVSVRQIVAADLPKVSLTAAGIAPAPTSAQATHVLRPSGWSRTTLDFGTKTFTGQSTYVWSGFPSCTVYRCSFEITMNLSQYAIVQLGASGTPKVTGYVTYSNNISVDNVTSPTTHFSLWRHDSEDISRTAFGLFEMIEMPGNRYSFFCTTHFDNSKYVHHTVGHVTVPGPLDYMRITTSGPSPAPILAGSAKLVGS